MTGTIAPHENRELELIASGDKVFAVIEKAKNPAAYFDAGAIADPRITVCYRESTDGPEVIVTRKRSLLAEYESLLIDGIARLGIKNYHRAMGALFGYSRDDIETFIASEVNCNCTKCKGA